MVVNFGCTLESPGKYFEWMDACIVCIRNARQWGPNIGIPFKGPQVILMYSQLWETPSWMIFPKLCIKMAGAEIGIYDKEWGRKKEEMNNQRRELSQLRCCSKCPSMRRIESFLSDNKQKMSLMTSGWQLTSFKSNSSLHLYSLLFLQSKKKNHKLFFQSKDLDQWCFVYEVILA